MPAFFLVLCPSLLHECLGECRRRYPVSGSPKLAQRYFIKRGARRVVVRDLEHAV